MSGIQRDYGYSYETVAASQTSQVLGNSGAAGDYLHRLIITNTAATNNAVTLTDLASTTLAKDLFYVPEGIDGELAAWQVGTDLYFRVYGSGGLPNAPLNGYIKLDSEIIRYTGMYFYPEYPATVVIIAERGCFGTVPAYHLDGTPIICMTAELTSSSGFAETGVITCGTEKALYRGISGNTLTLMQRSYMGTTVADHTATTAITAGSTIPIQATGAPIGVYPVDIQANAVTASGWRVTTGASSTAVGVGLFT
jgi:hypothetical protein